MKNYLLILFSLLSLAISQFPSSSTQSSLSGKIMDEVTKGGLIAANVLLFKDNVFVKGTTTDYDGNFHFDSLEVGTYDVEAKYLGYQTIKEIGVQIKAGQNSLNIEMGSGGALLDCVVVQSKKSLFKKRRKKLSSKEIRSMPTKSISAIAATSAGIKTSKESEISIRGSRGEIPHYYVDGVRVAKAHEPVFHEKRPHPPQNNEGYEQIVENTFINPMDEALSTFSIDVDRASYSNVRRYIDNGQMPPENAVRIEEMINYFDYDYPQPKGDDPIALHTELTDCPWNKEHQIMHIGLQAKEVSMDKLPPSNLVFLIDVSGSMSAQNKLPLVKSSFMMLLNNLRKEDRVAIVTYAGSAGLALASTPASEKEKIISVVHGLGAGGSTAGAEGILTAYEIAKENFMEEGNNRVILATDGDFNVGISNNKKLERLIEKERESGVFLSVLGFGMGNYKDDKMQVLAGKGNGNHAYIDNIQEARKVFINEFGGTLFTLAKDVKLQIEFNPAHVAAYRLIGYENRLLNKEDFNDDTKDAGEMGSGHVVTAMYEIVPVGSNSSYIGSVDALKYQQQDARPKAKHSDELATIKFRYKKPRGMKSKKVVSVVGPRKTSIKDLKEDVRFSLAVAEFGMIIRNSSFVQEGSFKNIIELASNAKGIDEEGYRAEFVRMVKSVDSIRGELAQK